MDVLIRNDFEQSLIHYMEPDFLALIQKANVGIAGAGGLGSNIANALVRTGVINFVIADYDKVQMHNLNRQNYFPTQVGDYKALSTLCYIKAINSNANVDIYTERVTEENINTIFKKCDIVFEAFDDASCKKMMLENMYKSEKILVFGSGLSGFSMEGEALFVREVKKNIHIVGFNNKEVDKENPPFASKVIAVASVMANVGINGYTRRFKK